MRYGGGHRDGAPSSLHRHTHRSHAINGKITITSGEEMSKGSKRRPSRVDRKTFEDNWDRIFSKKKRAYKREKRFLEIPEVEQEGE